MQLLLCLPFSYAFTSRYKDDLKFYLLIEYLPAVLISIVFGRFSTVANLACCGLSFLAFISVYEIGYLVNDYISVRWEGNPRLRGSIEAGPLLFSLWCLVRCLAFWGISRMLQPAVGGAFWGFYVFLVLVFAAHNLLRRKEIKICTFYWLSLCRFVAPTLWLVKGEHFASLLAAGAILYSGFRLLGYMESKRLLNLPNRKSSSFRLAYYALPLPLAGLILYFQGLSPFPILSAYYASCALLEAFMREGNKSKSD